MMERNKILLAGKKLLILGLLGLTSLFADYKLVLTDVDGNQTEQCIKSYSFSNNLESIAKQQGIGQDIYSQDEVMTDKIYKGKPVYRKIVKPANSHLVQYIFVSENIDYVVNIDARIKYNYNGLSYYSQEVMRANQSSVLYDLTRPNEIQSYLKHSGIDPLSTYYVVEYTKTTDVVNTTPNKFQSYLIYKLSSTTDEEVTTKNMKNLGVQILEGYSYDVSTNSCIKN